MNTTAAAQTAGVTVATIRTWCAKGVIGAVKHAGRWVIDETSLRYRIALAALKRRKEQPVTEPLSPAEQRKARHAAARAEAEAARSRLLAGLQLPTLTGSPEQLAYAEDMRRALIEQALNFVIGQRNGTVVYDLAGMGTDPLQTTYLPELRDYRRRAGNDEATEAETADALHTAVTRPERTAAAWWINNNR